MTIEQDRQKIKDHYQAYNDLSQKMKLARSSKDRLTLNRLNKEFAKLVLVRKYIYRGWALDEAVEAINRKLDKDAIIKQLQENISFIISATEKERFLNEFLNYVFENDEDTITDIKTKLVIEKVV